MDKARYGDKVRVRYSIQVEEDADLTYTIAGGTEQLTLGEEELFPNSDLVIIGMDVGESRRTRVPAELLFGPCRETLVRTLHPEQLPAGLEPEVAAKSWRCEQKTGTLYQSRVTNVSRLNVILDAYRPLAERSPL